MVVPRAMGFGAGARRTAAEAAALPLRVDCSVPLDSCDGLLEDSLFGALRFETHKLADGGGDLALVNALVHDRAALHSWPDEQREDFVRRARAEMVLARYVREWVAVATAVREDDEDGVVAQFRVGFDGLDDLPQSLIHDGNGARVMAHVAPMDVVAVLVIDHEEPGPQFLDSAHGQLSEQAVAARIHKTGVAVILAPALPESFEFLSLAVFALGAVVHLFPFGQLLLPLLDLFVGQFSFRDLP